MLRRPVINLLKIIAVLHCFAILIHFFTSYHEFFKDVKIANVQCNNVQPIVVVA